MSIFSILRRLFETLWTLFLVTAIAAFIWLYAEQKTVRLQSKLDITLEYGTREQRQDLFILAPGAPRRILVSFMSSNRTGDDIRAKLAGGISYTLPLDIPADKDVIPQTFSMRERLEKTLFHNTAASNIQVDQDPQIALTVKRLKTVALPLDTDSGTLPIEWKEKPETVSARLPASIADIWMNSGVRAMARLDPLSLTNVKPGEKVTRQVTVEIPALTLYLANPAISAEEKEQTRAHLDLTPSALSATFTLEREMVEELRIPRAIPVTLSAPPSLLDQWAFSIPSENEKFINDLRLSCTPEAKERIAKNEADLRTATAKAGVPQESPLVWAVVRVTSDEIPANGLLTLPLEIMTPSGTSIPPSVLLPKTITVKAVHRNP